MSEQVQDEYWLDHVFEAGQRERCGHVVFLVEGGWAVRCEKLASEHVVERRVPEWDEWADR